jgi:tetratricopeptide (TPR) repeat protein
MNNDAANEWTSLNKKFYLLDKRGLYDSARIVGEQALNIAIKNFSGNDVRIARNYNNLAEMYRELGQIEKSVQLYSKGLIISESIKDTSLTISLNTNMGLAYSNIEQNKEAKIYFEKVIKLIEKSNSFSPSRLITPFSSMGLIELDDDNYKQSSYYLNKALQCTEENYSKEDLAFGRIYENLGALYVEQGNMDSAFHYLNKSKINQQYNLPLNHPLIANLYELLGGYYIINNDADSAFYYYTQSIESRSISNGTLTPKAIRSVEVLAQYLTLIGDSTKMDLLLNSYY